MHPSLRRLLTQTVDIKVFAGLDAYGDALYASDVITYACRIVAQQEIIKSETGVEVLSVNKIILAEAPGITTQDELTMPDGSKPKILSVASYPDQYGVAYEALMTE